MRVIVPPIKCQGIKTKLVNWIKENAVLYDDGLWIEPFVGSGVVGFNVRPKKAIFSDTNPHIINFYNNIKEKKISASTVRSFLESEGEKLKTEGEKHYYNVRERFNDKFSSLDFLFLNRSCFNGVIRFNKKGKFNVPFCRKEERFSKAYITKIVNQVANLESFLANYDWKFIYRDYVSTIKLAGENDFIYCDPPYIDRHVDYYNSWSHENERKLFELLLSTKAKFILSTWHSNKYRENNYINEFWSHFYILIKSHFYHVGGSEENRNSMNEALVMNYKPLYQEEILTETPEQLVLFEPKSTYRNVINTI
jgi:DNA adenine methylase